MIGVAVITHKGLAEALIETAEFIMGEIPLITAVTVQASESVESIRSKIKTAIGEVNKDGQGVIVLTDMFGGTPANISLSLLDEENIEVITGVNLPMIIKLATCRNNAQYTLRDLAIFIKEYGQKNISVASEILSISRAD